ncbi:MAG: extracellular solute-binding protein [Muribaculaceae bacterium]|nr:extracellular solute-binding protein [Muribaculaceae bacterium]
MTPPCRSFPDSVSGENSDGEIMSMLRNGEMPFYGLSISDFRDIRELEQGIFGEPVTFMGYPDVGGNGSVARSWAAQFAVFADTENKDGAWEFIKYFYSEEYQDGYFLDPLKNGGYLPVRVSALEKLAEEAKQPIRNGNKYIEPYITDAAGNEIPIGTNTDEDNQKVYDLLNGAVFSEPNYEIINIIKEEAGSYFSGQKSAEQAAEIIQNRVQNYLDEQS